MVSVEVVGQYYVFVEGDMVRNKYYVGLVKCSERKRHVELFVDNLLVRK